MAYTPPNTTKDYSPLSTSCVRSLNDKLYEKRKVAALEIEKMVKEFLSLNNHKQINQLLHVLGNDFAYSQNPNSRKGGLIGLAAVSIALGRESGTYVNDLVKPVLTTFYDNDSRVRYYGCESMFNIVKVTRSAVLPFFNDVFDGLGRLAADPDQNVRTGSELLDRLMKDIVTESRKFDLVSFIPLLRERVYTKNPFARSFIVSWINTLVDVPDIDMLVFLSDILDGLFEIIGDSNAEIRKMCEATVGEFLKEISENPKRINFSAMINILIAHSQSQDDIIQLTAVSWIKEFVHLSGKAMIPYASGIITAILPCLSYDDEYHRSVREAATSANKILMNLVEPEESANQILMNHIEPEEVTQIITELQLQDEDKIDSALDEVQKVEKPVKIIKEESVGINVSSIMEVLMGRMLHESMQTRIAALGWIQHLHIKCPQKVVQHVHKLFPLLLKMLSDPSDKVVLLDLEVLAEISSTAPADLINVPPSSVTVLEKKLSETHSMNRYFSKFMMSVINLFSIDQQLLEYKGQFIIRQLCLLLNAEDIYRCCSEILIHEENVNFASDMIRTLGTILLTATELFELRTKLKDLNTQESCTLFCCLYRSWCHNPISTISLCLLTQNYKHAYELLMMFSDLEVTVEFLTEIDKLVQLLESPIFAYLRLQLLDTANNQFLVKCLYGILMLLPQSDAFNTLRHRLECIPSLHVMLPEQNMKIPCKASSHSKDINFEELKEHFKTMQEKHKLFSKSPRGDNNSEMKFV